MTNEQSELLFFDTFSHDTSEELNLDLVQFTKTVCVTEVRIIPLGARVQADFPGGVRLGATNPSQFKIEFFVNDLSKPRASTFESVGGIEYNQNGNIHLVCEQRIPTDGVVLRGWYTTITLAVYGYLTKAIVHENPSPGPLQAQVGAEAPTEWPHSHPQVGEMPPGEGYLLQPSRDAYNAAPYPSREDTYPSSHPEYPGLPHPHPYQDEWPQPGENYDPSLSVAKEGYEGEPLSWEQRTPEDKSSWERKERDRDVRHRGEREFREHSRECSPDYERSRGPRGDYHRDYPRGPRAWSGRPRSPPPHPRAGARTPPPPPVPGEGETRTSVSPTLVSDHGSVKKEGTSPQVPFESLSPGDVESISEGEIPEAEGEVEGEVAEAEKPSPPTPPATQPSPPPQAEEQSLDVEPFEPILSDEEIADDSDAQFQDMEYDFGDYPEDLKTFNPYTCELNALVFMSDPAKCASVGNKQRKPSSVCKLSDILTSTSVDFSTAAAREDWVHAAEKVVSLLPAELPHVPDFNGTVDTIISWVKIGLDFDNALNQPQPGYKLRHIKVGVRLVEVVCNFSEEVSEKLFDQINVHQKLIELFHKEYMALSIKLMILRSLDASLHYKSAVESFLKSEKWNGYQKLLEMLQSKQLARVSFALTSVLQKISYYELLDNLNRTVTKLVEEKKVNEATEETDLDIESITNSLEEIICVFNDASKLISQPKRFLPVSAQFEIGPSLSSPDPYPALFTYFRTHKLLETLLILLTHPGTSSYSPVVIPIYEILTSFQQSQDGLRFLLAEPKTINSIVRVLLGGSPVGEEPEDSASEQNSQLGLHLAYRLQALSHIDSLLKCYHEEKTDPNHPDVIEHLHALFCLTFGVIGKMAVVHVLSRGDHLSVLLKYFKENAAEKDPKVKKSPGKSYIADMITMTVKLSDHVPFLQKYGKELLDVMAKDKSQDLNDLTSWLKPVESSNIFAYDDISILVEILKKNIENCTTIPGEMITAVRILKHLGIPPNNRELAVHNPDGFEYIELKYKCVMIQLFSLDGISHLAAMMQKLCENYEQPTLHAARLVGRQGLALTSFLHPAVQLVRRVVTQVIKCRNTEYKDLTLIQTLLHTYSLMQAVPLNAQCHLLAQQICRNIVETLLAYTQPVSADPGSETEALNKSLWTLMMTEVLKYTVFTPNNFLPGLSLVSEMLPLPLQVQTRAGLATAEISRLVHARKLWSAHLHCLSSLIHEVISTISASCCSPLLQLLRSVCVQLADLAAPTALTVTRAVLDCIVGAMTPPERPATGELMRLLTFLACLVTHASIKAALIHLVTRHANADKAHQRYPDLIVSLCHMLRAVHDSPTHVQAQECILSVVQSLCHCELSLMPPPGVAGGGEMYLANTLPPRDLLGTLILVMLEHVSNPRHSLTTLQPVLRTFLMLTEHDYGFFHLSNCVEKKPEGLWTAVSKVVSVWSTERAECRDLLNILLELLRNCLTPDTPDEVLGLPVRTLTMTAPELAHMLGWQKHSEENKHPLYAIDNLLQESRSEDETLETLCESVTELIRLLEEEGSKPVEPKEVSEPLLPAPDSLLAQFTARPVFVVGDVDDDRLTASYWLTVPLPDDQDTDMQQQVKCDLMEVARQELPDLALAENVATLCRHKAAPGDLEHANPEHRKKRASNLAADTNQRRPFVAPMRGRGFRGSVQRGDMFRSRPPNTSRPPSLHVDDFVALETCGQQPTGPTGYNKISMRVAQDMIATRVRGRPRPFGMDRGGRFFPTPYSRRENGREGLWHGDVSSNGSSGPSTGSFRAPPPDMRGAPHFPPRPQLRGPLSMSPWATKDGRERFSSPSMRGGPSHHNEPNRHVRFFSR